MRVTQGAPVGRNIIGQGRPGRAACEQPITQAKQVAAQQIFVEGVEVAAVAAGLGEQLLDQRLRGEHRQQGHEVGHGFV